MKIIHFSVVVEDGEKSHIIRKAVTRFSLDLDEVYENINIGYQPYDYEPDADEEPLEDLKYDENTLNKVYAAFYDTGLSEETAREVVNGMQNRGILFRERK